MSIAVQDVAVGVEGQSFGAAEALVGMVEVGEAAAVAAGEVGAAVFQEAEEASAEAELEAVGDVWKRKHFYTH